MGNDSLAAAAAIRPLFYREPEMLSVERHAAWRLLDGDLAFAARTAFVRLQGLNIVDREKLAALDDGVMLGLHRAGHLPLIHFHLASLDRFTALPARQSACLEVA